ncbi:MAG: electron transfer flavoprotein subunit alpha/FixB family protein [Deltaproteobacteria bacterium]|nr:electron transfer flavoprotein subunit alpha/FixB family protein [Deltaproteobacteria bacterium]
MGEILVLMESRQGEMRDVSLEMLTLASRLAAVSGERVTALVLASQAQAAHLTDQAAGYADSVLTLRKESFAVYQAGEYEEALAALINERRPGLTLAGHTAFGMDFMPRLASRLDLPLATDCLSLSMEGGRLTAVRQMYGGKINADVQLREAPGYLVTIRPGSGSFGAGQAEPGKVEVRDWSSDPVTAGRTFINYLETAGGGVDITQADILVSVGRGIGKPENIPLAEELARILGAELACSRPVADKNWLPKHRQVGTSGRTVKPKVYLALGISGAFQHQAGMKGSKTIIAINKDPKAPIFNIADYGVVGDLFQIVPALKDQMKAILKK